MLAVGAEGGCLDISFPSFSSLFISPFLEDSSMYIKYCHKEPFNLKQPTKPSLILSATFLQDTTQLLTCAITRFGSPV